MGLHSGFLVIEVCVTLSALSVHGSAVTVALPPKRLPQNPPNVQPIRPRQPPPTLQDHNFPPIRSRPSFGRKRHGKILAPSNKAYHISSPMIHSPTRAGHSLDSMRPSSITLAPSSTSYFRGPTEKWVHGPASSPLISFHKHHHHTRNKSRNYASGPVYPIPHPSYSQRGPMLSPFQSPLPSSSSWSSHVPAPASAPNIPSGYFNMPILQPAISPTGSALTKMKASPPIPVMTLPPPPPNEDCAMVTCTEPLTYTPPGRPCGCVWPIQVKLQLGVAIYTFFPRVTQLTEEIAASVGLNLRQVRIMGANAASQQLDESIVLINLVPQGVKFNDTSAFLIYKKFWERQVSIKDSLFGAYEVLYVHYPGLPPSPPSVPSTISTVDRGPYTGHDNKRQALKPLGVDVLRRKKGGISRSMIAVIILSSFIALVLCVGIGWLLLFKYGAFHQLEPTPHSLKSTLAKPSGATSTIRYGSMLSSSSISFDSSTATYTGAAKPFTLNDIERATNGFDFSRIIGEGGFGIVYRGILDDGREVAVKVLKRDNQHGGREFLAEVEMLSRLHHRNLVKLIGICIEGNSRSLVYELVHNGSVESHLHGFDKVNDPLDWEARMKIALGAARGLAYLHEDSSPRVIHRDFKCSNILLEHDFTPKVSDFGLARTALDEGNKHISTHVMGTFGYLAPEYAMTGHLLVKSDVYSYGVVLLELLTGRKPVDLSQPPGQENLVAWARPLLTSKEGLETIIDPAIKSNISYDSIAKVAAIASMCVQPEVSHRPFMGEVVQALKLICNEFDETKELDLRGLSEDYSVCVDSKRNRLSSELVEVSDVSHAISGYGVSPDNIMGISTADLSSTLFGIEVQESGSFMGHSSSGPIRTEKKNKAFLAENEKFISRQHE